MVSRGPQLLAALDRLHTPGAQLDEGVPLTRLAPRVDQTGELVEIAALDGFGYPVSHPGGTATRSAR